MKKQLFIGAVALLSLGTMFSGCSGANKNSGSDTTTMTDTSSMSTMSADTGKTDTTMTNTMKTDTSKK